jgi:hypothetical protein
MLLNSRECTGGLELGDCGYSERPETQNAYKVRISGDFQQKAGLETNRRCSTWQKPIEHI